MDLLSILRIFLLSVAVSSLAAASDPPSLKVGSYLEEVSDTYGVADGLPSPEVHAIASGGPHTAYAGTEAGLAHFDGERWVVVEGVGGAPVECVAMNREDYSIVYTYRGAVYTMAPDGDPKTVQRLAELPAEFREVGSLHALAAHGGRVLLGGAPGLRTRVDDAFVEDLGFAEVAGGRAYVWDVSIGPGGRIAVGSSSGLFLQDESGWRALYPVDDTRSWAPRQVRAVHLDPRGRLWFGSPQGVGCLDRGKWTLYEGKDGLPFNQFSSLSVSLDGAAWFGTSSWGAMRYDGTEWRYRQGLRWLPADGVRDVAVARDGTAWFATERGVGRIRFRETTLADKAIYLEDEIDRHHRRTPYGYVLGVTLKRQGDRSAWTQHDSDNDGLWTAMYGAGECFAYAATGDEKARQRARKTFEALRFLNKVTQEGSHPAPPGYVARTIRPTDGPNPNDGRLSRDRQQKAERDRAWKIIDPRWPVSADGKWYWKSDTSSDELDGHYFFYARYYDLVAKTEAEKARVREVVVGLTDLMLENEFNLIDHDGLPTRWGRFGPKDLNHNTDWWEERGLNSLSMLAYLKVAEHVSGDVKYAEAATDLIEQHSYLLNTMYPKNQRGVGSGNHSDDEMAFMGFYNLLSYEKDPHRRSVYAYSFYNYWRLEYFERSPLFNFMYAAVGRDETWKDAWGKQELRPMGTWLEDSVRYLKRYPRDRVEWGFSNSHRLDLVPLPGYTARSGRSPRRASLRDGKTLPIDERFIDHWNQNPWQLGGGGNGMHLADGASFLLPYYMGLYHGFIREEH